MNRRNFFGFLTGATAAAIAVLRGPSIIMNSAPVIKTGMITAGEIACNAITADKLVPGVVGNRSITGLGFQPQAVIIKFPSHAIPTGLRNGELVSFDKDGFKLNFYTER